jgi:hypothetical protein
LICSSSKSTSLHFRARSSLREVRWLHRATPSHESGDQVAKVGLAIPRVPDALGFFAAWHLSPALRISLEPVLQSIKALPLKIREYNRKIVEP